MTKSEESVIEQMVEVSHRISNLKAGYRILYGFVEGLKLLETNKEKSEAYARILKLAENTAFPD